MKEVDPKQIHRPISNGILGCDKYSKENKQGCGKVQIGVVSKGS